MEAIGTFFLFSALSYEIQNPCEYSRCAHMALMNVIGIKKITAGVTVFSGAPPSIGDGEGNLNPVGSRHGYLLPKLYMILPLNRI